MQPLATDGCELVFRNVPLRVNYLFLLRKKTAQYSLLLSRLSYCSQVQQQACMMELKCKLYIYIYIYICIQRKRSCDFDVIADRYVQSERGMEDGKERAQTGLKNTICPLRSFSQNTKHLCQHSISRFKTFSSTPLRLEFIAVHCFTAFFPQHLHIPSPPARP